MRIVFCLTSTLRRLSCFVHCHLSEAVLVCLRDIKNLGAAKVRGYGMGDRGSFSGCSFLWVTNCGAAEITANSIASLQPHLRNGEHSLFVGTLDGDAEKVIASHIDCSEIQFFRLDQESAWRACNIDVPSDYKEFGTGDFRLICKAKYYAITKTLRKTGKPVVFSDGDIVFLQNPAEFFESSQAIDSSKILAQNDRYVGDCNGEIGVQYSPGRRPKRSQVCAGFTGWQPTAAHLKIAEYIGRHVSADTCDQTVFNKLPFWKRRHIQLLPQDRFPNGSFVFGDSEDGQPDIDLQDMYMVHANWMLGVETKISALKGSGYWYI